MIIRKYMIFALSVYTIACIAMLNIPLFNILGYEFSFAFAIINFAFIGDLTLFRSKETLTENNFIKFAKAPLFESILLILYPLVFISVKEIFFTSCNYFKGLAFYVILSCISAIFGYSVGIFGASLTSKKIYKTLLFLLISSIPVIHFIYQIGYGPTVDSYNHIFGYFAGSIYDEIIEITPTLIYFRIYSLIFALTLIATAFYISRSRNKSSQVFARTILISLLSIVLIVSFFTSIGTKLGYVRTTSIIKNRLPLKIESKHFVFYYTKASTKNIDSIVEEFEFRFSQLERFLKVNPDFKTNVFIYPDAETKHSLMGARDVFIAKPTNRQIHMRSDRPENMLIKHELTHILAGSFGLPLIKLSPRILLVEGLAVAAEGYQYNMTYDEYAKALFEMKLAPDIEEMIGPLGFWSKQSRIAYYISGSFCKFIIDKYGIEKFKRVYAGKSFESTYGKRFKEISSEWEESILKIKITDRQLKNAEMIFKPKGIFSKKCAHEVACLSAKAKKHKEDKEKSVKIARRALKISGDNVYQRRLLMNTYSRSKDYNNALKESEKISKIKNIPDNLIVSYLYTGFNSYLMQENFEKALYYVEEMIKLEYSPEVLLENLIFKAMLNNASLQKSVKTYRSATHLIEKRQILVDIHSRDSLKNIKNYLRLFLAHMYVKTDEHSMALKYLKKIDSSFKHTILGEYYFKLEGKSYFEIRDYESAKRTFKKYLDKFDREANKLYVKDWLEKIEFAKNSLSSRMKDKSDIF